MSSKRVVLLARAGGARDRTEAALQEAGAHLEATFDPVDVAVEDIQASRPETLLIVLDPVVDQALGKLDALLGDPALEVMFEDSDIAAHREGWEFSRWVRHLRAKLQGHDDVLPRVPEGVVRSALDAELEQLNRDVASLPEVPPAATVEKPASTGAVVIVAGVGGPDAVRQLLADLPEQFQRPILLRQRIEGGQYGKLVRQMGRVTKLPVAIAQDGDIILPGHVYVMPENIDVHAGNNRLSFVANEGEPGFAALRPADSAMLVLSGADIGFVDAAMTMRWAGGLVAGQSADNCFDPATSNALVARGGEAMTLAAISRQLHQRWLA